VLPAVMIDNSPPPPPKTLRKVGIINSDVKHKPAVKDDATSVLHAAYLDWSVGEILRRRKRECGTKSLKKQGNC